MFISSEKFTKISLILTLLHTGWPPEGHHGILDSPADLPAVREDLLHVELITQVVVDGKGTTGGQVAGVRWVMGLNTATCKGGG